MLLVGYTPAPINRMGQKNTRLAKTALGAEKTVQWKQYKTTKEALNEHPKWTPVVVEQSPTAVPYTDHATQHPLYIFGNETDGVQPETLHIVTTHIRLPMHGTKESLNITACIAVVLYHHLAQNM